MNMHVMVALGAAALLAGEAVAQDAGTAGAPMGQTGGTADAGTATGTTTDTSKKKKKKAKKKRSGASTSTGADAGTPK